MNDKFPVINFSLIEFTRRLLTSGRISFKGIFLIPVYCLQIIPTLPLAFLQFLIFRRKIRETSIPEDPVFILGHYRSGTTLLQKLMASDRRFGYLNYYDALFPNTNLLFGNKMQPAFQFLIKLFRIKNPFFHDTVLQLSEPDEEDDYLMNKGSAYSAYWGLVFPKRWREWLNGSTQWMNQKYLSGWKREYLYTLKYLTFRNKGKQLVLKSPPNTERISILMDMFPQSKFIFIYRNPFHMYYSIRNMWERVILRYYSFQKISKEELDEIIFNHFEYLTDQYEKDKSLIPPGNLVEISYEALKEDSFKAVRNIYRDLDLPDFHLTSADLIRQIEKEKVYQNFHYQPDKETMDKVEKRWEKYIRQWGY